MGWSGEASSGEGLGGVGRSGQGRPSDGRHAVAGREGKEVEGGEVAVRGAGVAPWCGW